MNTPPISVSENAQHLTAVAQIDLLARASLRIMSLILGLALDRGIIAFFGDQLFMSAGRKSPRGVINFLQLQLRREVYSGKDLFAQIIGQLLG
ncbi:hypothetical protein L596_026729 [Steinernema carpocapsae]|uniref:Uncharacterized protein n=1 Tax=Steinernema carpocapsae TaxID=34508 RepID=A0A4V5ZY98_STECR|nr:hypothetical protein L596_026729 [Steinernema carpocapsae]